MTRTTSKFNAFGRIALEWIWSRSDNNYRKLGKEYYQLPYPLRECISNYYPFGSSLPTRSWSDLSRAYRFGFNTQEKDNEVASEGNSYTAEFWQYDCRLGRRWNLDPQPQVNISDYSVNKLNPVLFHDWRGNVWTVGTDNNSKSDVLNLVSSKNKGYVKIAADGSVSLDFGGKSKKKIERILKKDKGLKLINTLVEAKEKYFYSSTPIFNSRGLLESKEDFVKNGGDASLYDNISTNYLKNSWTEGSEVDYTKSISYKNASENSYGKDGSGNLIPTILPQIGYNGQVGLAPGEIIYSYCTQVGPENKTICYTTNVRIQILMHELYENYLRTSEKLSYDEAHKKANELFWGEFSGTLTVKR